MTLAVLIRFTWTFLPTVTIDLPEEMASGMPPVTAGEGPFLGPFRDDLARAGAYCGHTVLDG